VNPSARTVTFDGQLIDGFCVSATVTVKLQLGPELVEQTTLVVPIGKNEPGGGVVVTSPHDPVVVGAEKFTTAPHCPVLFATVIFAGHVMVHVCPVALRYVW
jgi:hypothetical protein